MDYTKETILENNTAYDLVTLWNEYCEEINSMDDIIFAFDEDNINEMFTSPFEAMRSASFGEINFSDDYYILNGYGNIETKNDYQIEEDFDWHAVAEWLNENREEE